MNIKDSKITILVIFGIVAIMAVVIYAFAMDDEVDITISNSMGSLNSTVATNEYMDPLPAEDLTDEEKSAAESRDQQRIEDIDNLKLVLDDFVNANGYYPDTIDEIVPDYISELPIDPLPESYEYSYTCIGSTDPCVFYDLSYTLEVGTEDLPAGMNIDSPDEIATP